MTSEATAPETDVTLLDTEVEQSLRASLRDLLGSRCRPEEVVRAYDGDRSLTPRLWPSVAVDLGLAGLLVPEEQGGAGASAREAAVVLEELGRFVAPVPFLTSAVLATTVALAGARSRGGVDEAGQVGASPTEGTDAATDLVAALASGETTAALLVPLSSTPRSPLPRFTRSSTGTISGGTTSVAGAHEADVLLVPVQTGAGVEVYAVPAASARITPVVSLDETRPIADVTLIEATGECVVPADRGDAAVRAGLETATALLPSEQAGIAAWCAEATVAYLKERRQFGRVVGGFQVIKHRLADLYLAAESAAATARQAAVEWATARESAGITVAVASSSCSEVALWAAEESIQLHGGIGMTWEHPAHLYLKRAKADEIALGLPGHHRRVLAGLVDLPAPG